MTHQRGGLGNSNTDFVVWRHLVSLGGEFGLGGCGGLGEHLPCLTGQLP
jgi:hypothetical protein